VTATVTENLQGTSYSNFINAIGSEATKKGYNGALRRYMNHLQISEVDNLLIHAQSPKMIQSQIIDYIMTLRNNNVSYNTIKFLIAPIFTYYQFNDVGLNRKTISKYLGEFKRVVKDGRYTNDMILQYTECRSSYANDYSFVK
jgi:hypothetical protein